MTREIQFNDKLFRYLHIEYIWPTIEMKKIVIHPSYVT